VSAPITVSTVDSVLAVQLTVAWPGESRETTKRLGWWHTDLVDIGGGDFLARLLPPTHAWRSNKASPARAEALGLGGGRAPDYEVHGGRDDSVADHALAVPVDDRSARMPKRRGRT
jgi:hypothetical protein